MFKGKKQIFYNNAEVAHLVERDLAKVEVAGSSPVFRSKKLPPEREFFFGFSFFSHAGK